MRYSDDLRRKLIEAWESNRDTQRDLADQFGVSLGWVEKVLRRWRDTGHSGGGRVPARSAVFALPHSPGKARPATPRCHLGRTRRPSDGEWGHGVPGAAADGSAAEKRS